MFLFQGRDGTWKKINARFYWRGGQKYVAKKVAECIACSYKNNAHWTACMPALKPIPVTPKLFWSVHCEVLGPLAETLNGKKYIALGVCALSKYVEAEGNLQISKLQIKNA